MPPAGKSQRLARTLGASSARTATSRARSVGVAESSRSPQASVLHGIASGAIRVEAMRVASHATHSLALRYASIRNRSRRSAWATENVGVSAGHGATPGGCGPLRRSARGCKAHPRLISHSPARRTCDDDGDALRAFASAAAWITLDSPENRNALSAPFVAELGTHLRAAIADPAVRAIVLTGNGPAFCAGADLKNRGDAVAPGSGAKNPFVEILRLMWDGPKPVIVAANGHAFGGGVGLIAAADIAIAVDSAMLSFSEVRIGVIPAMISVVVLPKLGVHHAMRLFLTGARFKAAEARDYGLVHRVVPAAELARDGAGGGRRDRARRTERRSPRRSVSFAPSPGSRWTKGFAYAEAKIAELFASPEAAEGMMAFATKRKPSWAE